MEERERALAFLKAIDSGASTSVERFRFGTAYLRPELPRVWSRNFVWIETEIEPAQLASLLEDVERIHAGAALPHRRMVFERGPSEDVATDLTAAGWKVEATQVMVYRGDAGALARDSAAREVEPGVLMEASKAIAGADPAVTGGEETVEQLTRAAQAVAAAIDERCFAAVEGGAVVSFCRLYSDGRTGQIEEVGTVPALRGRGYADTVVSRALAESAGSHEMTFLLADEGDWPKQWYERLGFRPIGLLHEAVRS